MDDYFKIIDTINPAFNETGTDMGRETGVVVNEYNGAPVNTESDKVVDEIREFDSTYSAPKRVLVKRYKLKKI